jgi:hypothetical protein
MSSGCYAISLHSQRVWKKKQALGILRRMGIGIILFKPSRLIRPIEIGPTKTIPLYLRTHLHLQLPTSTIISYGLEYHRLCPRVSCVLHNTPPAAPRFSPSTTCNDPPEPNMFLPRLSLKPWTSWTLRSLISSCRLAVGPFGRTLFQMPMSALSVRFIHPGYFRCYYA